MSLSKGSKVLVHYTGTLDDGTQFDSSRDKDPLEVIIGQDMVIPGFEKAIVNMDIGQTKVVTIPEHEAYGAYNEDLVLRIPRTSFPADLPATIGTQLVLQGPDGQESPAFIIEVNEQEVTLDANHPLAGFELTFEIEVVSISSK